jgi:hypothetical protein
VTQPNDVNAASTTIRAGRQHLSLVAEEHGFRSQKPIWDDPGNAALRKARVNPNTLAPLDIVALPVREPLDVGKATNQFHQFVVGSATVLLNLKVQDSDGQPLATRSFVLATGEPPAPSTSPTEPAPSTLINVTPQPGETTGQGEIQVTISPRVSEGELRINRAVEPDAPLDVAYRLLVGHLGPPSTIRGQQARLNNLGYFAGFTEKDVDQLRWAIEEFQHDHGIKPNGKTDDPTTFNKIAHVHGDLLAAERVP